VVGQHRKIYEQHYGIIPVDETGRKYDVHHIDGNHNNNDPTNLIAVSIQEHYDIHFKQGDWRACLTIALRMKKEPSILSELATKVNLSRVAKNKHPFLGGDIQRKINAERVENRTHNFLGKQNPVFKQLEQGTHRKFTSDEAKKGGTKQTTILYHCDVCGRSGYGNRFKGSHFNKCVSGVSDLHDGLKHRRTEFDS
jgi:hypothetical protein